MTEAKYIKTLRIDFDCVIKNNEIPFFRGAVLESMEQKGNILFHNHIDNNLFRYSYPLIQYKRIHQRASIVAIDKGVEIIGQFLQNNFHKLTIGRYEKEFNIYNIIPNRILIQLWKNEFDYRIRRWSPLNSKNYQKYKDARSLIDKIHLLEVILKGNLLSMCKGLDIHIVEELKVKITKVSEPFLVSNKDIKMMAFDIEFSSNLSIPNYIGIGKNASIGYGIITMNNKKQETI